MYSLGLKTKSSMYVRCATRSALVYRRATSRFLVTQGSTTHHSPLDNTTTINVARIAAGDRES